MKIQFKLILVVFAVIAVLMAVVGVVQIRSNQSIVQDIENVDQLFELMVSHNIEELHGILHTSEALEHTRISLHKMLLSVSGAKEEFKNSIEEFHEVRKILEKGIRAAETTMVTADKTELKEHLADLAAIEEKHEHIHGDADEVIALIEQEKIEEAIEFVNVHIDPELEEIHEGLKGLEEHIQKEIAVKTEKVDTLIHRTNACQVPIFSTTCPSAMG